VRFLYWPSSPKAILPVMTFRSCWVSNSSCRTRPSSSYSPLRGTEAFRFLDHVATAIFSQAEDQLKPPAGAWGGDIGHGDTSECLVHDELTGMGTMAQPE